MELPFFFRARKKNMTNDVSVISTFFLGVTNLTDRIFFFFSGCRE